MFRPIIWALATALAVFPALAYAQVIPPGFPPGTFNSRAPLDAATGGGGSVVTFDAKTATGTSAAGGTSVSATNMTVGSGSNRVLVVGFWFDSASTLPAGLACNWDPGGTNQSMTAIPGTNTGTNGGASGASELFGLVAPTSGNKTLTCSWTGTGTAAVAAISFTGAIQTGGATTFANGTFASATASAAGPISMAVTSQTNDYVAAIYAQNCIAFGAVAGTQWIPENDMSNLGTIASYNTGAATVTMTAAYTGTCPNLGSAVDIVHQ